MEDKLIKAGELPALHDPEFLIKVQKFSTLLNKPV